MPPEPTTAPQPTQESPSPAVEAPTEASAPEPVQATPEAVPAPTEAVPIPETAQIPPNEPLPPEPPPSHEATEGQSEPFDSAPDSAEATTGRQDKPTLTPEPPSAVASTPTPARHIRDFLTRARIATQDRKRNKRDKIMLALTTKNKITNDEVEKLLHVSDATATRYLSAIEKEGKIKQVGKTGHGVVYSKI